MSQPFSFVQITDIHIGVKAPAQWLVEDLRQINSEVGAKIDFIAATGDLTDTGTDEQCRAYADAIKATRHKVHPVVGNHDYVNGPWDTGKYDAGSYQAHISPLNYSFDHKGVHFVSYDSIQKGNESSPSEWLLADLAAQPSDRPIILLVHYQLPSKFYDALKAYNIVATLSGHWHTSRLYHDGKIAHFNSPSLCFGGIDYSPRGYRVFHWDGTALHCETVPLRRPPPKRAASGKGIDVLWSTPLDADAHMAAPVVSHGRVIAGLMNENQMNHGALACWNGESGKELWRIRLNASIKNTPAVYDDSVIAVTVTGEVLAVNIADGSRRWTYQLGEPSERWIFSSPRVHNDRVYAGHAPHFAALAAETGKPLWVREKINGSDWISSYVSPSCHGDHVYMGFFWGRTGLMSLDAHTGETRWQIDRSGDTSSTPIPDGNGALYVMRGEFLQKLNASTGDPIWKFKVGEVWNPSTPLVEADTVYAASGAGKVFAVDAESGAEKWSWECNEDLSSMLAYRRSSKTIVSSPRRAGECIAIGCNDGRLVGLNAATGQLKWEHDFGVPVTATPTIANGRMYLPSRDGRLYVLRVPL
ncbi:MAG TPA: PQQ-binding-like beta-propeller repeat protein [Planctomycetota bacterium]|nr:PQQ-binding-like beta-propeller repeat protein [Planctomycetota bacterium]